MKEIRNFYGTEHVSFIFGADPNNNIMDLVNLPVGDCRASALLTLHYFLFPVLLYSWLEQLPHGSIEYIFILMILNYGENMIQQERHVTGAGFLFYCFN